MTELKQNKQINSFYKNIITNDEKSFVKLKEIGDEITKYIISNPNDIYAYILLNETLIKQGLAPNAILIAEKIWDIGRKIEFIYEKLYLNQLIDLGLNDKSQIFCKDKIDNLDFSEEIYKLSIQNSELFLLKKTLSKIPNKSDILLCNNFINYIQENKLDDTFNNVMEYINDLSIKKKIKTQYQFINNDDTPILDIKIYINNNFFELDNIENQISEFFTEKKTDKFINLSALNIT